VSSIGRRSKARYARKENSGRKVTHGSKTCFGRFPGYVHPPRSSADYENHQSTNQQHYFCSCARPFWRTFARIPQRELICLSVVDFGEDGIYSFNKKSSPSNTPFAITFMTSDLINSSNSNDFKRVCVVRTEGSRKSPNGKDVLNNW
jgi:hypothetical protein